MLCSRLNVVKNILNNDPEKEDQDPEDHIENEASGPE